MICNLKTCFSKLIGHWPHRYCYGIFPHGTWGCILSGVNSGTIRSDEKTLGMLILQNYVYFTLAYAQPIKRFLPRCGLLSRTRRMDQDVSAPKLQILNRTHISNPTAHSARIIYTITAVSRWRPKISATNSVSDQMSNMVTISPSVPVLRLWIMTRKVFLFLLCRSEFDLWPFGYKLSWHHYYRLFLKKQHFLITRMWILEFKTQPLFTKLYPIVG